MKIVSLQSICLGTYIEEPSSANGYYNSPYEVIVGQDLYDGFRVNTLKTVEKIEVGSILNDNDIPKQIGNYLVYTSDGHIRVFPSDSYIAEWSE